VCLHRSLSDDELGRDLGGSGLLAGAYLGALLSGALLVFGAVVAARLRRAEGSNGGWWVISLCGIAGSAFGIVGNVLTIVFVRAVGHGASGNELWVGYGAPTFGPECSSGFRSPSSSPEQRLERGPRALSRGGWSFSVAPWHRFSRSLQAA
jgi:hypothetical protein